jgi:transposase-like protein
MGNAALQLVEYERRNLTQLASDFGLDKATVKKRLQEHGIEPVETRAKETIYEVSPRLAAVLSKVSSPIDEAKLREATANAEIKEIKLAELRGEMVEVNLAIDRMHAVLGKLYKDLSVHMPKHLAARLARAKTVPEVNKLLKLEIGRIFARLKQNDAEFVPEVGK